MLRSSKRDKLQELLLQTLLQTPFFPKPEIGDAHVCVEVTLSFLDTDFLAEAKQGKTYNAVVLPEPNSEFWKDFTDTSGENPSRQAPVTRIDESLQLQSAVTNSLTVDLAAESLFTGLPLRDPSTRIHDPSSQQLASSRIVKKVVKSGPEPKSPHYPAKTPVPGTIVIAGDSPLTPIMVSDMDPRASAPQVPGQTRTPTTVARRKPGPSDLLPPGLTRLMCAVMSENLGKTVQALEGRPNLLAVNLREGPFMRKTAFDMANMVIGPNRASIVEAVANCMDLVNRRPSDAASTGYADNTKHWTNSHWAHDLAGYQIINFHTVDARRPSWESGKS